MSSEQGIHKITLLTSEVQKLHTLNTYFFLMSLYKILDTLWKIQHFLEINLIL